MIRSPQQSNKPPTMPDQFSSPSTFASPSNAIHTNPPKRKATEPAQQVSPPLTRNDISELLKKGQEEQMSKIGELFLKGNTDLFERVTSQVRVDIGKVTEEQQKLSNEFSALKRAHTVISSEMNDLKQEQLINTMEIVGLSHTLLSTEPPLIVLQNLLTSYGITFDATKIQRVFKREYTSNMVKKFLLCVAFNSYDDKMETMKAKQTRDKGKKTSIFFNHALTHTNRAIFMSARKLASTLNMRANVAYGRIYIKNVDQPRGTRLQSLEDVEKFAAQFNKNRVESLTTATSGVTASVENSTNPPQNLQHDK